MGFILHIGQLKKNINLKPNQTITPYVKDAVAVFYMLTGIIFTLQGEEIINFGDVLISTLFCIDILFIWVLLFVFLIAESDSSIIE